MVDPDNPQPGYASAVDPYWQAGWRGILPLKPGHKGGKGSGLPTGYTGYGGIDPSYADCLAWAEVFPNGNLCLRLPDGIIGIDVDEYGAKRGAAAFAEAGRRWGGLPPACRSTSRDNNPISGIRLFRVPQGTQLETTITFPDLGLGDIEIIQHHHRYVVSWPSIHPEGRPYRWRTDDDQFCSIPNVDQLPWLPQSWIDGLKVTPRAPFDETALRYDVQLALTPGEMSIKVNDRVVQALREMNLPGTSRHDTCCRHVMALARLGKQGESGVHQALKMLCEMLVNLRRVDGSDTPEGTRNEFVDMLTGDNLAKELAQPGLLDWVGEMLFADSDIDVKPFRPEVAPQAGVSPDPAVPRDEGNSTAPSDNEGRVVNSTVRIISPVEAIERGFWQSRDSLAAVYQTSMAKMCPPWSVLAICAARALTMVRPHVTLPPLIGGPGSLNWFGAIVAGPAGGKTTSGSAAELLVPGHLMTCYQGTGEGILASFGQAGDPADPQSTPEHEAVFLDVDEVDGLGAVSQRSGSTTMPILRSAFSGATIAFSYSNKDKRRFVRKHTYRMAGIVGMQPKRAGWVLADADGGTPQRFMWFPASDPRVRRDRPWEAGPLTLPSPGEWLYPRQLRIPEVAENLILDEHVKRQQGDGEALDGHALFCREKFAYALTILDGRIEMNEEDWELSGVASDISFYTREMVLQELKEAARLDALDRGEIKGIEMHAADDAKEYESADKVHRILRWALEKIGEAGLDGIPHADLHRKLAGRDRRWLAGALQVGVTNGLINQLDSSATWVKL